ncbi:ubiquitin-like protein Pup [Neoactinobaculum massilliense]|uniref:ubiquitin-like protein Pup n=1 Tax=Neoactinobaculum massilliense TaxID=2364794 RepID=UPI0013DD9ACB|nr:ubiquitin-like protein Pup [Neoactinobaculum massilliense]
MSSQEFAQPQRQAPQEQEQEQEEVQVRHEDLDVDALLDDIDSVLETNASEFVQGFVQKGGE